MLTQEGRFLSLTTPLGADELLLEAFQGIEELSRPYRFRLDMLSEDGGLDPRDIVGQGVSWQLNGDNGVLREFHGIVRVFTRGDVSETGLRSYHAVVVPWLGLLDKRRNCRIFQEQSVTEIVSQVFDDAGFSDYELAGVQGQHPALEYCVQYNETDLDFVSRLLEEEGIFYSFRHESSRHVLVLADSAAAYSDCEQSEVGYSEGSLAADHVSRWEHRFEFVTGLWTHTDYNFKTPRLDLLGDSPTIVDHPAISSFEQYEYPGRHIVKDHGDAKVKALMEAEETAYEVVEGTSACYSFGTAKRFKLKTHSYDSEAGGQYMLTGVRHSASEASYSQAGSSDTHYRNDFVCIPASLTFRPRRRTPVPRVYGPETAIVVGPSGEEIYTDEYGRIKVQFHWDREGSQDENSSCWIRVASHWAQTNWGMVTIPRIGQEVVVDFLNGDPDRPLITGCVYNNDNMPPYELPANKTQTGIKSRSTKGATADNFNEIRFEDKKGSEEVYLQAEKDRNVLVKNDNGEEVGHDETIHVGNDRSLTVDANKSEVVGKTKSIEVGSTHTESVTDSMTLSVGKNRSMSIADNLSEEVGKSMTLSVSKDRTTTIGENITVEIGKDSSCSIAGKRDVTVSKESTLKAKKIQLVADDEISFKTGSATIVMKKSGDITIKGKKITVKGSSDVVIKGSKVGVN